MKQKEVIEPESWKEKRIGDVKVFVEKVGTLGLSREYQAAWERLKSKTFAEVITALKKLKIKRCGVVHDLTNEFTPENCPFRPDNVVCTHQGDTIPCQRGENARHVLEEGFVLVKILEEGSDDSLQECTQELKAIWGDLLGRVDGIAQNTAIVLAKPGLLEDPTQQSFIERTYLGKKDGRIGLPTLDEIRQGIFEKEQEPAGKRILEIASNIRERLERASDKLSGG